MKNILLLMWILGVAQAQYLTNHSCKECHEKIYEEYQSSQHAKTYFNDALHRKVADLADPKRYACATCHMPAADNIDALISGKARPDRNNPTHADAISCYFCHTIAYVKKAHQFNINVKSKQAAGYKPTLYGRLQRPDSSDKHDSVTNPIYAKNVCTGCHSHKLNEHNVTIFRAMERDQNSLACIKCHMPKVEGGAEKMDKRARGYHASHKFLGIHDAKFRATGVDINITIQKGRLDVTLHNKMAHPLIIQPARVKFLKILVKRGEKILWQNYRKDPQEDRQAYFAYHFEKNGKKVVTPADATEGFSHNLEANAAQRLSYRVPKLHKGDLITVALYVQLAKNDCASVLTLEEKEKSLIQPLLIKQVSIKR